MNIISSKNQTAFKSHICDFCRLRIDSGEIYNYAFIINGEGTFTWRTHIECMDLVNVLKIDSEDNGDVNCETFLETITLEFKKIVSQTKISENVPFAQKLFIVKSHHLKLTH